MAGRRHFISVLPVAREFPKTVGVLLQLTICSYGTWYDDPQTAMKSIKSLFDFDADPNVLVVIAHDMAPKDSLTFFPKGTINDWKSKGYKEVSSVCHLDD